jgi:hypothetical protein
MLPGDPNRVFNAFAGTAGDTHVTAPGSVALHEPTASRDPTTIKPQESNPFSGE